MMKKYSTVIAIDGPAGSGKSTVAKMVAQRVGANYVNTGSLYRAIAWAMQQTKVTEVTAEFLATLKLEYRGSDLYLNNAKTGEELRTAQVASAASKVAALPMVREYLLAVQRDAAKTQWIVMEGRDIATVVFPDAKYKFFVTATPEERARRRFAQAGEIPDGATFDKVLQEIRERDERDMNRAVAPLRPATDATIIDTTHLTIPEVVTAIAEKIVL